MNAANLEFCSKAEARTYFAERVSRHDGRPTTYRQFKADVHAVNTGSVRKIYRVNHSVLTGYRARWGLRVVRPGSFKRLEPQRRVVRRKTIVVKRTPFTMWSRGETRGRNGYLKKGNAKVRFGGHVFWTRDDRLALDPSDAVALGVGVTRRATDLDALSRARFCVGGHI